MGDQARGQAQGRLILVKHGRPQIAPDQPRSHWALSPEGRIDARSLARKLGPLAPDRLACSPEPKARDTALAMGLELGLTPIEDAGFREQEADHNPFVAQEVFEAQVARMFARPGELVMGEETGDAAQARFGAALGRLEAATTPIIVAHGRVITLWLSRRLGFEPMPFWKRLGLGTAAVIDIAGGEVDFVDP
ncbi:MULTISPECIES: histidine phosphatase family protein [Phenylobacterium]|uniref:Phosphoglycerate mutase n=1 Tax=Phenylobacterium koreense TaxID=266125 RepID=A0ABV2EED9_9CAUL